MLALRKIAVTGGLSSGKSTVCRFFEELGAYVVSADEIVHQLLTPNTKFGQAVIHLLGSDIVVNQQIDRSKVAEKVFGNQTLLKSLEKVIHPAVRDEIDKQYDAVQQQGEFTLFVAEVPLLFESDALSAESYHYTVVVMADKELCIQRYKQLTGRPKDEFDRRMIRQLNSDEKAKRANYVLYNNGDLTQLRQQVRQLYQQFLIENNKTSRSTSNQPHPL